MVEAIAALFLLSFAVAVAWLAFDYSQKNGDNFSRRDNIHAAIISFSFPFLCAFYSIDVRKSLFVSFCWFMFSMGAYFLKCAFKPAYPELKDNHHTKKQNGVTQQHLIHSPRHWLRR